MGLAKEKKNSTLQYRCYNWDLHSERIRRYNKVPNDLAITLSDTEVQMRQISVIRSIKERLPRGNKKRAKI